MDIAFKNKESVKIPNKKKDEKTKENGKAINIARNSSNFKKGRVYAELEGQSRKLMQ